MKTEAGSNANYLLCYTRKPLEEEIYAPKLAHSMHLAFSEDGKNYLALNHNSGVLFAKATENDNGTLSAKSLKNPYIFYMADGTFGVIAVRIEYAGEPDPDSKGCILLFTSSDLLSYKEIGLIYLKSNVFIDDAVCEYSSETKQYEVIWRDEAGNCYKNTMADIANLDSASHPEPAGFFTFRSAEIGIEGAVPRNAVRVSREIGDRVRTKLSVLINTEIRVPETVTASSDADMTEVKATAVYNDGSTTLKRVLWDTSGVNWKETGTYKVTGKVHQDAYPFPIAVNRADPCIIHWKGKYYFIATNDDYSIHSGFYVRAAATVPELMNAEEVLILGNGSYPFLNGVFWWAPEFHKIEDELYVFFAGSSGEFGDIQSYVMKLKMGGNPVNIADWEMPIRVRKKDGTYLFEAGITLDMTYFEACGKSYVVWAQRQFKPVDLGSWLYIATVDPKEPWKLTNDPVIISKPEYGWANNHTFVDEGPFAIISDDRIMLTFSSALVDATYCVGILTAGRGADLLNPNNWIKGNYPLLTSRSVPGQYGTGHNCFVRDDDGNLLNVYHARPGIKEPRCTGIRRVHFDIEGDPVLNLTEERDLSEELKTVTIIVAVTNR